MMLGNNQVRYIAIFPYIHVQLYQTFTTHT